MKCKAVTLPDGNIDVDSDPLCTKLMNIEDLNKKATNILTIHGLDGNIFRKRAPRLKLFTIKTAVTAPLSREHQYVFLEIDFYLNIPSRQLS